MARKLSIRYSKKRITNRIVWRRNTTALEGDSVQIFTASSKPNGTVAISKRLEALEITLPTIVLETEVSAMQTAVDMQIPTADIAILSDSHAYFRALNSRPRETVQGSHYMGTRT